MASAAIQPNRRVTFRHGLQTPFLTSPPTEAKKMYALNEAAYAIVPTFLTSTSSDCTTNIIYSGFCLCEREDYESSISCFTGLFDLVSIVYLLNGIEPQPVKRKITHNPHSSLTSAQSTGAKTINESYTSPTFSSHPRQILIVNI